jgi:hypothetical protein
MIRLRNVLFLIFAGAAVWMYAQSQATCQVVAGFGTIQRELGPGIVGRCLEDERFVPESGNTEQRTENGVFVYSQLDGATRFVTDTWTWTRTPDGLRKRLTNGEADQDEVSSADSSAGMADRARLGVIALLLVGVLASLTVFVGTRERRPTRTRWDDARRSVVAHRPLPTLMASPPPEPVTLPVFGRDSVPLRPASRGEPDRRAMVSRRAADAAPLSAPEPTPGPTPGVPFRLGTWMLRPLLGAMAAGVLGLVFVTQVAGFVARTLDASDSEPGDGLAGSSAAMPTVFDERFIDSRSNWLNDPMGVAWFAGTSGAASAYQLFAREPGRFVAVGAPIAASFRDVIVTAQFRKTDGPPGGAYGLILRSSASSALDGRSQRGHFYLFEAGDTGTVGVLRRDDDRWVELVPRTTSAAIRPGDAENELSARAIGDRLAFLINGIEVANLADMALTEGATGVYLGGDLNQARVQRFVVEAPALRLGVE